ncbi:hypothetical protein [Chthonomonas calidirosea]|uniref:hypothetical protein n=1 Tax=Chthonomonas calidirosea TaxID=454171 RepID=UPI0003AA86E1|nr:hypothetical protein [Chthonomonas calidirosea]
MGLDWINFSHITNPNDPKSGSTVQTPPEFYLSEDKGTWGTCQLITPNIGGLGPLPPPNENQQTGLDNWFPEGRYYVPADGYPPVISFVDTPDIGPPNNVLNFSVDEQFQTTMMYLPPPQSTSCWVPLKEESWFWNVTMTFQNGTWVALQRGANINDGPIYPAFPTWNHFFINFGAFFWTTFPNGGLH